MTKLANAEVPFVTDERAPRVHVAVSIVVPVTERPENLVDLYREFSEPLRALGSSFEFLFVAEPWRRDLTDLLAPLVSAGEPIRVYLVGQTTGEAGLLKLGADRARAPIVVTLPAYRRVVASVLPDLIARVEGGVDVAVARRSGSGGSWINRVQNKVFHVLLRRLVGGGLRDVACGVAAMRKKVLEDLPLYGDFFRFLPVLAVREGYRVEEVSAARHEADARTRLYLPGVYLRRLIDILGLFFLVRFTEKPLRFFGLVGSVLLAVGGTVLGILFVQRLGGQGIADRPMLLLGVLMTVLGVQAIALGLVGEIIVHLNASHRTSYRILEELSGPGAPNPEANINSEG